MKNLIFTVIAIFGITVINAQNYNFGKVSKAELEEKFHPSDSSANAAILYRNEDIKFTFNQNTGFTQQKEITMRIKIYNREGFEWATEKVLLYKGDNGNNEKIKGLKGQTYNLEGNKIKKDKLKSDGIFEEKASDIFEVSTFTMPNIKEGSVIEYTYKVISPFLQIDDVNLQFRIPVKKLDAKIATPQIYRYNARINPKAFYVPAYTTTKEDKTLTTTTKVRTETRVIGSGTRSGGGTLNSTSYDKNDTNYFDNVILFNLEDIPALKAESFAGNINNYRAKLSLEYEARLSLSGVVEKSYASSWDRVSKSIYDSQNFGGQLVKFNFYKDDLNSVLEGVEDDFQKAFLVENLVKSKVKWNGNYGKYAQKGIRSAYKDGEGNVADINLLVTSMLQSIGLNANPVLISTRNNGVPLFPTREGFNYVICMVQSGNSYLLIDATEPYSAGNVLPERVLNWQGRLLLDGGTSRWVNIKPNEKSSESTMLNVKLDEDFIATGKVRKNFTSYLAMNYRKRYTNLSTDDHIKSLESNKGALEISELSYENDKDLSQPVKVTYDYELSDGVDEVGDKLYFSPLLFLAMKENPFKLEERLYPIDFVIPYEDKYMVNIMLPDGYVAESLPQSEAMSFKEGQAKFDYVVKENGKYLQLMVRLEISNPLIQPVDYEDFKAFFSKIVEKQGEQIVLTKT
ncbi:DUF3857 domain-containing protein [Winogradskyella ouciana]|uniref:DUF3857 domain-containing protein n=1 Tax=Winogradskyella ouciana TaxID=2608631 RepID=A0A7K1GGF3_9FLAO|nr:DUF3857 domain-containing protein [Winogradskyella ouciana]MTE28115.1 DUF3857 domain-containing protein [Winogradskyella ouciana]